MKKLLILTAGRTPAVCFVRSHLETLGYPVTDSPSPDVTHLLLDVPSFGPDGSLRGGGNLGKLLDALPDDVTVCGGKLAHPALQGYKTLDLLLDPDYLAANAYITAEAALDVALPRLPCLLRECPVLILGWGRIGKCLAQLLKNIGAAVTVAARKDTDRAMLRALGYAATEISELSEILPRFRLIFNTVPRMLLPENLTGICRNDCVKIDLASQPGMAGAGVITARGLPGLHKPESSGTLMAETLLRLIEKEDSL